MTAPLAQGYSASYFRFLRRRSWAVTAAKAATRIIPIIGLDRESDPIANGFVKSLARSGENITGMFLDLAELSGKQLQIRKEIIPKLPRVAILGDPAVNASQTSGAQKW